MASDSEKKDLTGIVEYSRKMEAEGTAPPIPEGSVMEEQKIEKIDAFESLEEYSKANPMPEPASAPAPSSDDFSGAVTGARIDSPESIDALAPSLPAEAIAPPESLAGLEPTGSAAPADAPGADFSASSFTSSEQQPSPPSEAATLASTESPAPQEEAPLAAPPPPTAPSVEVTAATNQTFVAADAGSATEEITQPDPAPFPSPAPRAVSKPSGPVEQIKHFSERIIAGKPAVQAAYPFSLLIVGHLAPDERERLLDILSREQMGFSEVDLEPQFEGGRILLPRISEYAGVLIVQALRSAKADIRLGPSDTIFATETTRAAEDEETITSGDEQAAAYVADALHPAEHLPVTPASRLPGMGSFVVIDSVTASASLKTSVVEAESSSEYQEVLEGLQRELKYKAYRRGATAIVNFSVSLTPLSLPTHYRLTVLGTAVRPPEPAARPPEPMP